MKPKPGSVTNLQWLLVVAVVGCIVHMITYNMLGFHRDELLYLALGRHLNTGYWSTPPLIGIIGFISQLLPGDALFTTRLIPALAGALLVFVTGLIAREMGGNRFAILFSAISISCSLLILRGYSMLQPVPFDILFWTLILYWLLKYANSLNSKWLIYMGIGFGLGLINKYMVVFLGLGILIVLPFTRLRSIFVNKYTWLAVLIMFLIFLPNLIWQANHNFPVLKHMQELKDSQLVNVKRMNILLDQLLMFTISSVVWVAGLLWLLINKNAEKFRPFAFVYLVILAIFLILKGKSYYLAGLYPFLFAAGGVAWERMVKTNLWRLICTVIFVMLSLPGLPGGIPIMKEEKLAAFFAKMPSETGISSLLRWEDGLQHPLPQDFADMLGWDELAGIVIKACDTIDNKSRIFIYAENYGQAGAIDLFGRNSHLPPANSFSDSYILWAQDSFPPECDVFLYVNDELGTDIIPYFEKIDSLGSITNPFAREFGTTVYMYRKPTKEFSNFLKERVNSVKEDRLRK